MGNSAGVSQAPYILIVEDNKADVFLIEEAMTLSNVEAQRRVIGDGEKAIQYFAQGERSGAAPPLLIVLDLNLPRRDGFDVLRELRRSREWSRTPVLMVTSSNASPDRAEAARLGAQYFTKPSEYGAYLKLGDVIKAMVSGARNPS